MEARFDRSAATGYDSARISYCEKGATTMTQKVHGSTVFAAVTAGLAAWSCAAAAGCTQPASRPAELAEVVIVGTQHFISDMPEGYTPGHLRALLKKISPDLLAVETPANVGDPWAFAPLDLQWITKPWADERGLAAVPVGWHEPRYQAQLATMVQAIQNAGKSQELQTNETRFQQESAKRVMTCEFLNSEEQYALWRNYHAALHKLYGQKTPWEEWNAKILANVTKLSRQHKGKRIALVFGSAHCYYLQDYLSKEAGVKVISVASFFPLTDHQIDSETRPIDHLRALRVLNFQNWGAMTVSQLDKLERRLEKVKQFAQFHGDYELFRGKLLLHRLKPDEALQAFRQLLDLDTAATAAFDGTTRLREAGMVFIAIAKMRAGRRDEARHDLEAVIKTDDVTPATKQWAKQLLQTIPKPAEEKE